MTDDFQLFPDSASGEPAIDADISLITAYLARELSLVQIVAVEERLATDVAFREKVRPVIEAWSIPASFGSAAMRSSPSRAWETTSLTRAELDAGWRRHVGGAAERRTPAGRRSLARVQDGFTTRRRTSMTRIAAVIAAIALPMVAIAQVVVYAAKRVDAPGHSVARRIVAPFVQEERPAPGQAATARAQTPGPILSPDDTPLVRPLPTSAPGERGVLGVEPLVPAVAATQPSVSPAPPAQPATPNRARIAALATQHLPDVARGDTAADYIVMVLDAADQYVWSTHGIGNFSMEVGADSRTPAERAAHNREHRAEYMGASGVGIGVGRARSGGGGDSLAGAYSLRFDTVVARAGFLVEEFRTTGAGAGGRGGVVVARRPGQPDSSGVAVAGARSGGGGRGGAVEAGAGAGARSGGGGAGVGAAAGRGASGGGAAVARGGGGGGGRGGSAVGSYEFNAAQAGAPGTYRMGFSSLRYNETGMLNQAYGLQESGGGQSGIQGLLSSSVSLAELYTFPAGALTPQHLRIVVVHLTPGTTWNGR